MHTMKQDKMTVFAIAIVAAATTTMVVGQLVGVDSVGTVAKMTASSTFVALALGYGAHRTGYGRLLLAGFLLSWIGDLALAGTTERQFMLGLGSFLLAHLAYISAFLLFGVNRRWLLSALIPIALISLAVSIWLAPFVPVDLAIPVRVYTIVISLMVVAAFGARGRGASLVVPVGALLFYFSDLSVATGQFAQTDFPNYVWGLPFYFAGQVLLAISVRNNPKIQKG